MRRHLRVFHSRRLAASVAAVVLAACLTGCDGTSSESSDTKPDKSAKLDQEARLAIVDQYVEATHVQQEALRGAEMEVEIDAKLPGLAKHGTMQALRVISRLGQITYKALGFSGDNTVKQEVIARYLAAESEARDSGAIAITPANYKFRYSGRIVQNGETLQILELTPRKNAVGLFKGELWVDARTGMPVRESGQFVKTPSVFLKKIVFTRDYELHDGVSFPSHIESTVETRIVGRAELQIYFKNFAKSPVTGDANAASSLFGGGTATSN
jgi:hypothetical protein